MSYFDLFFSTQNLPTYPPNFPSHKTTKNGNSDKQKTSMTKSSKQFKKKLHKNITIVLVFYRPTSYSWAWGLPRRVADIPGDTPLDKQTEKQSLPLHIWETSNQIL